ncbi:PDZ domain-containing protein [Halalkalibacterium halodurans]|uniref:BH2930 protein n=1 Tax=Halalkalibacterium halodurans (strain ATCC BAA-125 / DSM 18197 / FERM 7344 / JCM 9153 / C-125) TaxID=272558 RepID=Q9K8S3_HALH5|nr:PDZ domain-containing protein [Halalkalibacterium halodurans]MED4174666.1 PDZ domain-containing protein [Halalkalibacterium halodurans]BAB06649.1 BH2930 [Halalkalibacterium halodurans C-125]
MKISIALVAIPLFIVLLLVYVPVQEEYNAKGNVTPVSELGIEGSVYFTYVHTGIIENYLEKFFIKMIFNDAEFIPLEDEEFELYSEDYEEELEEETYKEQTIVNAVHVTTTEIVEEQVIQKKVEDILSQTEEYDGNSFGLMIAIGLMEEMNLLDYSWNHSIIIAGTGTMEYDGTVGSVGAIRQKLLTAADSGVDVFFIPKDEGIYGEYSNESEARQVIEEENLDLLVVPVETLDEAIDYLENDEMGKVFTQ